MESLHFYNNTSNINELWYDSHRNLIFKICNELNASDQFDSLVEKFLGKPLKMKKFKDPKKPKRAKTSYLYFCDEMRADIKKKNPNLKMGAIMKELGQMWKKLSEEEKYKYNKLYENDKIRYEEEMATYE